jgi:hypothetical protein
MARLKSLFVFAVIVMSASVARGGAKSSKNALIEQIPGGYRGSGAIGSVRAQTGPLALLWCRIESGMDSTGNMILCHVTDQLGNQLDCALLDNSSHSLTSAIAAMNSDSYVIFEVAVTPPPPTDGGADAGDAGGGGGSPTPTANAGMCTRLKIENNSSYPPKT